MPSRGYRKGISDTRVPLPHHIYTRLSTDEYNALVAEADRRSITVSKLTRTLLAAHTKQIRAELPHPRGVSDKALRELSRVGNNLNQLVKQANTGLVAVSAAVLIATLDQINAAASRLG